MSPAPHSAQPTEEMVGVMGILGRNGSDSSLLISDRQCLDAVNVDWYRAALGRKRQGSTDLVVGFTAVAIHRHVPSDDQTLAEFWAMDSTGVLHRYVGGAWTTPTMTDPCTASAEQTVFQSFNGKLYIAYKSAHNRLHVWDPTDAKVRRVGLDQPAQLAAPVQIAGAIVADTRQYRVAWTVQSGGVTVRRSNLGTASASVVYVNQQGTFTRGAAPGEQETHWELWGASTSSSFGDFRLIATTVIATTTAVDNSNTLSTTVSPRDGANTPPPSAKYMSADDARIILGGCWELVANGENAMTPKTNRVWWTSILGASNVGDDERISNTGTINSYADLEESISGLSQPMQLVSAAASSLERGSFYVFSFYSQWKFVSNDNGTDSTPYLRFRVTGGQGAIHHKSIITSLDANGNPTIMWAASPGVMQISVQGQQFAGEDNIDLWATINLDATIPCHAVPYPDIHQAWFYIATGTNAYPNLKLVYDTRLGKVTSVSGVRQGWSQQTGSSCTAYCSCLFSNTLGATVGRKLKPHIGFSGAAGSIWKCDADGTNTDGDGSAYQAYIDSKSYAPWGLGKTGGLDDDARLVANAQPGTDIWLTVYRDEGAEVSNAQVSLAPLSDSKGELKVFPKFGGAVLADSHTVRIRVGDDTARASSWTLDAVLLPTVYQGVG